jgi:hypothetical protein
MCSVFDLVPQGEKMNLAVKYFSRYKQFTYVAFVYCTVMVSSQLTYVDQY